MATPSSRPSPLARQASTPIDLGPKSPRSTEKAAPDFEGAGQTEGLEIWRIENLKPEPVDESTHGHFYEGDSYIVLKTAITKSGGFNWDIFFWLGSESSQDEQGVAAYKTVELDDKLGGAPIQHREEQGYESEQFMQLFPSVQYLKGGVDAGFTKVERDVYEPRLLHLKGARSVRVSVVPIQVSSLNSGDVFIVDLGLKLIQWNGAEANKKEKAKALDVLIGIKDDERGGKATVTIYNQGEEGDDFWEALGGKGAIPAAIDDTVHTEKKGVAKLFRVSDAEGSLELTEIAEGHLKREMLDTNDVFLMDNHAEIFVWVGRGATDDERKGGMKVANDYCVEGHRPKGTKVIKVAEGAEPVTFKQNFESWKSMEMAKRESMSSMPSGFSSPRNIAGSGPKRTGADLADMVKDSAAKRKLERQKTRSAVAATTGGETEVWRIENFDKKPIDPETFGQLYAGDSYIVKYTYYPKPNKPEYILYFWLGVQSTADEKGAAALLTTAMDDELGGAATQVRVEMGKEPLSFISCFGGRMIVRSGGIASGFKNKQDDDSYDLDGVELFHIRGTDEYDTRAVQVAEEAKSLNSGDCFVLVTPEVVYAWKGNGANEAEHAVCEKVATVLQGSRSLQVVPEGEEPAPLWTAIGGEGEYPKETDGPEDSRDPMLFQCSNATGALELEPIFDFGQGDLCEDDVFLLDSFTTIWLWVGKEANEQEKAAAADAAVQYIQINNYEEKTPVVTVKSGSEPPIFTCHFLGWDAAQAEGFVDPYEAKLAEALANNPVKEDPPEMTRRESVGAAAVFDKEFVYEQNYQVSYEDLQKPVEELPEGVDPRKKEQYLSDEVFVKVLGSPRETFNSLKPWKQIQLKKAAGLF